MKALSTRTSSFLVFLVLWSFLMGIATVAHADRSDSSARQDLGEVLPRTAWQAVEAQTDKMRPQRTIETIVIHHSEGRAPAENDEQKVLQAIQSYHMKDKKWGDIAYHYLIAPSGRVFEGRDPGFRGDSGTTYDLRNKLMICVMGSYQMKLPTPAALKALSRLVAEKRQTYRISQQRVCGHRDLASTDCPGHVFYRWVQRFIRFSPPHVAD